MFATKPGNGGHGLEVYNVEDGKYAQVTCSFNGQDINSWEEYRDAILAANPQYKTAYNNNPSVAQQFDALIQDDWYPKLLQEEVDRLNFEGESQISFSSPEEAANNIHKLFGKKMINNLLENGFLTRENISVNPYKLDYQVSVIAACMQMNRYPGNNRMKPISRAEYDTRFKNTPSTTLEYYSDSSELRSYIEDATEIPVLRIMGISDENVWQEVKRSFWDPNSKINSTLSRVGGVNCSYFGSVCYMTTGSYIYDDGTNRKHMIQGLVKNKGLKITYCPSQNRGNDVDSFRSAYIRNKSTIDANLIAKLTESGQISQPQAQKFCDSLYRQIREDCGLCAMIMGYDAIAGQGYQFDIINPNIVDVVID